MIVARARRCTLQSQHIMCCVSTASTKNQLGAGHEHHHAACHVRVEAETHTDAMPTTEGKLEYQCEHSARNHGTCVVARLIWASTISLRSELSCCCSPPISVRSLAAASSCVNILNCYAAQDMFPCNSCCIHIS